MKGYITTNTLWIDRFHDLINVSNILNMKILKDYH